MSKIEELIAKYCPEGVEYVNIKDVAKCSMGEFVHKSKQDPNAPYPVYNGGITNTGFYNDYNTEENKVIVSARGAGAGFVNLVEKKFWAGNSCHVISVQNADIVSYKYLFYVLKKLESGLIGNQQKGGIPAVSKTQLETTQIPLPPLPIQEEIVRILDTFTELQAELQARQQQYQYYRDNLLSFEGRTDVEWKKLGEVAKITTGRRFVRTDIKDSGVPCFHYGDLYTYYGITATKTKGYLDAGLASKLRFAQPNDVVVVCAGENDMDLGIGVAWLGEEPAVVHDACCILHHEQNPRYISHFLRTHKYHLQMKRYAKNGKISSLSSASLGEAIIPIPSLAEQEKIANILDRFDTLVNDLSQGLPAEIEARKQQYEYYRDKLLNFKRKA